MSFDYSPSCDYNLPLCSDMQCKLECDGEIYNVTGVYISTDYGFISSPYSVHYKLERNLRAPPHLPPSGKGIISSQMVSELGCVPIMSVECTSDAISEIRGQCVELAKFTYDPIESKWVNTSCEPLEPVFETSIRDII